MTTPNAARNRQTEIATFMAATKIQALARGNRDRKTFEDMLTNLISGMEGKSQHSTEQADGLSNKDEDRNDLDGSFGDEEIVVVIEDDTEYTDHTRTEIMATIVLEDPKPPPPPPPKNPFERYNQQLKETAGKPIPKKKEEKGGWWGSKKKKSAESVPERAPPKRTASNSDDSANTNDLFSVGTHSSAETNKTGGSSPGLGGWWGRKKKDIRNAEDKESSSPVRTRPQKKKDELGGSNSDCSVESFKKAKYRWSETRNTIPGDSMHSFESIDEVDSPTESPVVSQKKAAAAAPTPAAVMQRLETTKPAVVSPTKSPMKSPPKSSPESSPESVVPSPESKVQNRWKPKTTAITPQSDETKKASQEVLASTPADEPEKPAKPAWKKPRESVVKPSALSFWAQKDQQKKEEPPKIVKPTRVWKKPKAKVLDESESESTTENPPIAKPTKVWKKPPLSPTHVTMVGSVPATTFQYPPDGLSTSERSGGSGVETPLDLSERSGLEGDGGHKISNPWLRPVATQSPASNHSHSPKDPQRALKRASLVNRYLSAAAKKDEEYEARLAEIEADRARGRWDGTGYRSPGQEGGKETVRKDWKFLKPKLPLDEPPTEEPSPPEQFDEAAAIKLQALARGFMARRRVVKYVDSLIEEMMRKLAAADEAKKRREAVGKLKLDADRKAEEEEKFRKERDAEVWRMKKAEEDQLRKAAEDEALRKRLEAEEEERRRLEDEETKRLRELEEERRKKEEAEIRRRMYDERFGLPLWWMEMIPHATLDHEDYMALVKEDDGTTVIDYKQSSYDGDTRKAEPLGVVAEETDDDSFDENDDNLNQILGTPKPKKRRSSSIKKSVSSALNCMSCMDAVAGVDTFTGIDTSNQNSTNRVRSSYQKPPPDAASHAATQKSSVVASVDMSGSVADTKASARRSIKKVED